MAGEVAFAEFGAVDDAVVTGEPVDEFVVEVVHGEAAVFPDVVAVAGPGAVVRVTDMPDGVDVPAAGAQYPVDLAGDAVELAVGGLWI